jgi:hypothetical protein
MEDISWAKVALMLKEGGTSCDDDAIAEVLT